MERDGCKSWKFVPAQFISTQEDLASNEIYYQRHCYNDMVRNCEKLETDDSIMDVKWRKAAIFDSTKIITVPYQYSN